MNFYGRILKACASGDSVFVDNDAEARCLGKCELTVDHRPVFDYLTAPREEFLESLYRRGVLSGSYGVRSGQVRPVGAHFQEPR